MRSKLTTQSTGKKNVKIGQYLAKIWTKYDSLVFLGHPVCGVLIIGGSNKKTKHEAQHTHRLRKEGEESIPHTTM